MTTLRDRILTRRAELLTERATAEAATGGDWVWGEGGFGTQELVSPVYFMGQMMHPLNVIKSCADDWQAVEADKAHIAAQDPATTIARVDRELAGIDADLALLDSYPSPGNYQYGIPGPALRIIEAASATFNARYPAALSSQGDG